MSYELTVWKAGDVVTSAKLNKLENGVANAGALIVNVVVDNEGTITGLDETYAEIKDAYLSGKKVVALMTEYNTNNYITGIRYSPLLVLYEEPAIPEMEREAKYTLIFTMDVGIPWSFTTGDLNGYPVPE